MILLLSICFIAALVAPLLHKWFPHRTGAILLTAPLATFVWLLTQLPEVMHGHPVEQSITWVQSLGLNLTFRLDGLSLLFALLISGIGSLILLYTQGYFKGDPHQGRFLMYITAFMAAMLGIVLADNLFLLFIFWELTSFTSYLLIGFNHESEEARNAALQAMLVTVIGGLFLMVGLVLLGQAAGTWRLSEVITQGEVLKAHRYYLPILLLICVGAFTKSAQFPFHFWLPNAMQAPTPASAYLHSSTMVKAGIFLLARLHPALGGTPEWSTLLTTVGTLTFLVGALLALGQHVLKRLLAYTTVSALGAMVMLLGLGTQQTLTALVVFILAHAFYKASLFLIAGGITHETQGETSINKLGGLRKAMPLSFSCALLAGLSMGGFFPFMGFVAKELWIHAVETHLLLVIVTVIGGAAYVVVGLAVGLKPFIGQRPEGLHAHEMPPAMRCGPLVLGGGCLALAFFLKPIGHGLVEPAAGAIAAHDIEAHLPLWAGFNQALWISILTGLIGIGLFLIRARLASIATRLQPALRFGPGATYSFLLALVLKGADWQTKQLQNGSLRHYIRLMVLTCTALVGAAFIHAGGLQSFEGLSRLSVRISLIALLMILATCSAVHSQTRLRSILLLGVVGFCIALLFSFYGAPDLAMTQLVIETLTVILMALTFHHLPTFKHHSALKTRGADLAVALGFGLIITLLVLAALTVQTPTPISDFYLENSYEHAHGRNVVNVILVDFRALDTLGEITVLTIAALGGAALLKLRPGKKSEESQ